MVHSAVVMLVASALVIGVMAPGAVLAQANQRPDFSRIRVLAIAPFADEVALSRPVADYGAVRLSELAARGRFQIIPPARVAEELRRLGFAPTELISPSRTIAVGQAVGADAVLTGRVIHFMQDRDVSSMDGRPVGPKMTRVDVDVRVLDVAARVNLFQDTFICEAPSLPHYAMDCVVRDVAARLLR